MAINIPNRIVRTLAESLVYLAFLCASLAAEAQTVPESTRIERLPKQLDIPVPPTVKQPLLLDAPSVFRSAVPKGAEKFHFILKQVKIEGATIYTADELAAYYEKMIGKDVSVADIYGVADAITQRYRDDGYVLARAGMPAQHVDNGAIVIHVVEGHVERVRFADDSYRRGMLAKLAERVLQMRPLHIPTLQHMLLAFNNDSLLSVTSVIEPLEQKGNSEGAVGLLINVERKHLGAMAQLDNSGSRFIGPWQQMVEATMRDGAVAYDTLRLRELTTLPSDELRYGSLEYTLPLDVFGTALSIQTDIGRSQPGYNLQDFEITGDYKRFALSLEQPWQWARDKKFSGNIGLERKDVQTDLLGSTLYQDVIVAAHIGLERQYADRWEGSTLGTVTLTQGINAFGARKSGSPNLSRANGKSDFTKIDTTITRLQGLGTHFTAAIAASGQYGFSQLLSSEQCGYGGMVFGRAYDASEITGDSCISGSVELRYKGWDVLTPPLHVTPLAFYDIGKTWTPDDQQSGASAGMGLRIAINTKAEAQLTAAFPLTRDIATPLNSSQQGPRYGLHLVGRY